MEPNLDNLFSFISDLKTFIEELGKFVIRTFHFQFIRFETHKGHFVGALYKQRGRMARRLTHSGMAGLAALSVAIAPVIAKEFPGRSVNPWEVATAPQVLSASTENPDISTFLTEERDQIIEYVVQEGDTVSSISQKFDISTDTIRWQNSLKSKDSIKVGQVLQILPISGVSHKVQKGDTIYSIAKKYDVDAQQIVNFPFNTYANDETFELAIGQTIIVPQGVKKEEVLWQPLASNNRQVTPNAGTVVASGSFVWPTQGIITTRYVWYHKGIDIANRAAPSILAADSGKVVIAGWPDNSGYGNRVMIDHGNGYRTLYAHMAKVYVVVGQTVKRGDTLGQMGSTGRSTGTHLHFEVMYNGGKLNPLSVLK